MSDAINLFELRRILCCSTKSSSNSPPSDVFIRCYAFTSNKSSAYSYLALFLTNARIVIYGGSDKSQKASCFRLIPWLSNATKEVVAMTFSPDGAWLLLASKDSTLYLIPSSKLMDPMADVESKWPLDDITEIKIQGRRALPTALIWWETTDERSIAVVGNELGEIFFINLYLSREVGGTYIPIGIQNMELIDDTENLSVYLLITGINRVQWQLVLERQDPEYFWPLENYSLQSSRNEESRIFASCEVKRPGTTTETKPEDSRPKRLDTFAGHTFLQAQTSLIPTLIAGYFEQNSIISMHYTCLTLTPCSVYKVPANVIKFVVQNKIIFAISPLECDSDQKYAVQIISTDLAKSSIDGHKDFDSNSRMQYFYLDPEDVILAIISWNTLGCIIITTQNVYSLNPKMSLEEMFTRIILQETNISKAERFGKLFNINLSSAYENVGDKKLAEGLVTDAIRLYQTAKCPHSHSVAKFASHGHISEVLSYIRILFTSKTNTFSVAELIQFSNMALLCYLQQCLEIHSRVKPHVNSFRQFLKENQHYDEKTAIHLLVKYGMFDILLDLSDLRGLFSTSLDEALPSEEEIGLWPEGEVRLRLKCMKESFVNTLKDSCYENLVMLEKNEFFLMFLLNKNLIGCFDLCDGLLWRHMLLTKALLPTWRTQPDKIKSLLCLYNPANLRCVSSLFKNRNDPYYIQLYKNTQNSYSNQVSPDRLLEISTYFIQLMLILINVENLHFDFNSKLILPRTDLQITSQSSYIVKRKLVSCGFAHSAVVVNGSVYTWGRSQDGCLGRESKRHLSEPIILFQRSNIRVLSVACGAAHTLVLTDAGLYSWGSNQHGQLGLGKNAPTGMRCQRGQPTAVISLSELPICDIACGQYHCMALTTEGVVYTWGWGVHGQLGHGNALDCSSPTLVLALKDASVTSVSGGYAHSLFQTNNGDVYVCGCGAFGQLGNGAANKLSLPFKVPIEEKVVLSAAGYFHNVVVTVSGRLVAWGCNPQTLRLRAQVTRRARLVNQAGSQAPLPCIANIASTPGVFIPTEISRDNVSSSSIVQIACGSNHTLLVTSEGDLFSWGRNLDGQLGVEDKKEKLMPVAVVVLNDRKITQVSCGTDFNLILDNAGKLWGFGVDNFGQICGAALETVKVLQSASGMSPSKIITVRTNRRIVQITSPTRNSVYKPLLLNGLPQVYDTKDCCEGSKTVNNFLVKNFNFNTDGEDVHQNLHDALEVLFNGYDSSFIKSICIEYGLLQAAAKIELLLNNCVESYILNIKSIPKAEVTSSLLLNLLEMYISLTKSDFKSQHKILSATILYWISHSLSNDILEDYLGKNISSLLVPLSYIVFGVSNGNEIDCQLSTEFCFTVVHNIMDKVSGDDLDPELLALVNELRQSEENYSKVTDEGGANELVNDHDRDKTTNQQSFIDISSTELDRLRRILPCTGSGGEGRSSAVVKVFSCGHLHTLGSFHRVAIPIFKNSLHYIAPNTTKQLADHYSDFDFQPMACPKCLVIGFQKDRLELAQIPSS